MKAQVQPWARSGYRQSAIGDVRWNNRHTWGSAPQAICLRRYAAILANPLEPRLRTHLIVPNRTANSCPKVEVSGICGIEQVGRLLSIGRQVVEFGATFLEADEFVGGGSQRCAAARGVLYVGVLREDFVGPFTVRSQRE